MLQRWKTHDQIVWREKHSLLCAKNGDRKLEWWMTKALKTSIKRKNLKEAEINYYEELFVNHKNSV